MVLLTKKHRMKKPIVLVKKPKQWGLNEVRQSMCKYTTNRSLLTMNDYITSIKVILFLYNRNVVVYRKTETRSASKRNSMKTSRVKPIKDDPPAEKNGSGIPMTGAKPRTIPMLMR